MLFDTAHRPSINLATKCRRLLRRLKARYDVQSLKEGADPAALEIASCIVLMAPTLPYSSSEARALAAYVHHGGSLLVVSNEEVEHDGSDRNALLPAPWLKSRAKRSAVVKRSSANEDLADSNSANKTFSVNELLRLMHVNIELSGFSVLKTSYAANYKHPKEAQVVGGAVCAPFGAAVARLQAKSKASAGGDPTPSAAATSANDDGNIRKSDRDLAETVSVAYVRGASLCISRPAFPLVTTGSLCYPFHMPIIAAQEIAVTQAPAQGVVTSHSDGVGSAASDDVNSSSSAGNARSKDGGSDGRIVVVGSTDMFSDEWIGREANTAVVEALFAWLLRQDAPAEGGSADPEGLAIARSLASLTLQRCSDTAWAAWQAKRSAGAGASGEDAVLFRHAGGGGGAGIDGPDVFGSRSGRRGTATTISTAVRPVPAPDIAALAAPLRPCMQRPEPLPADIPSLFDTSLFGFDTRAIPSAVSLYETLGVGHAPLSLIPPHFETPMPPLALTVFPPAMPELPPPPLECWDLEGEWATEGERLASAANAAQAGVGSGGHGPGEEGEAELAAFINQAGHICGIQPASDEKLSSTERASAVLSQALASLVRWKMLEPPDD